MRWNLGAGTGVGSLPGTDAGEAARAVAGELPELPYLPELPDRGVGADMVGRAVGLLVDLYAEVVPSGWRITARPGRDIRRAQDFLSWDLDAAHEQFAGAPVVKTQICGPWTLAAELELSSGNRGLTDSGAVDDLAASLTEGLLAHVDELARRVPGATVVVQIDEPALPAVLAGSLRTASGFGTVGAVPEPRVAQVLRDLVDALGGRPTIAHCCAAAPPLGLFRDAGFGALSLDLTLVGTGAARLDPIGEAVEAGAILVAGVVPTAAPESASTRSLRQWADPALAVWDRLGFPRSRLGEVVPTPTCGLAAASAQWARQAMHLSHELATAFVDPPEGW